MDEKRFLEILDQLSHWERPRVGPNGAKSVDKRAKKPIEVDDEEELEDIEPVDENKENTSIAPVIVKLKPRAELCTDCGKVCDEPRVVTKKRNDNPVTHWRVKCVNCGLYRDPNSKKFCLKSNQEIQNAFRKYNEAKIRTK